ncbi:YqjF family protein [Streptomyces sp. NPDC004266]|uniref:YqjF family protein n=1 Tax=Streptomyces sp. NPDC004266 TaxID=3364693 RepID=UPI00369C87B9
MATSCRGPEGPPVHREERDAAPRPASAAGPQPSSGSIFRQRWTDLVFVHWEVSPDAVAGLFPPGTRPDVLDGKTYVGLVFFGMRDLRLSRGPVLPFAGRFEEINVRLYSVDAAGRRGVVFLSLDCNRLLPVIAANGVFGLPYRWASARCGRFEERILYAVRRKGRQRPRSRLWAAVEGEERSPDARENFLTARWGLHARAWGRTFYWPLYHEPWRFKDAALLLLEDELVQAATGLTVAASSPASLLYSQGLSVRFGRPFRIC